MKALCGCCQTSPPLRTVVNRPALSAIEYRIGTYASFRDALLNRIAATPELASLSTRRSDDYAITILELWAAVADVLSFYQERYANEAFLGTATQRDSVSRLAYLIDYQLRPGAAALARLAFRLDPETRLSLPASLRVQSVPAADETPQIFETLHELEADAGLNRLRIYPQPLSKGALSKGQLESTLDRLGGPLLRSSLARGDRLLLFNNGSTDPVEEKKVDAVRVEDDRVVLAWDHPVEKSTWKASTDAYRRGRTMRLFGNNVPPDYMIAESEGTEPKRITWKQQTLSNYSYPLHTEEKSVVPGTFRLCLEGKVEGISSGQRLLIDNTAGKRQLVTVIGVDQAQVGLGSLTDTVTRLTVKPTAAILKPIPLPLGPFGPIAKFPPWTLPTPGLTGAQFALTESEGLPGFAIEKALPEPSFEIIDNVVFAEIEAALFEFPAVLVPSFPFALFSDRRKVLIHELIGPAITFWDSRYPDQLTVSPVYLPGRKVVDDSGVGIEVGLEIERDSFKKGVVLRPGEFEIGREVLLTDASGKAVLATVDAIPTIVPASAKAGQFCHLSLSLAGTGDLALKTASAALYGNVALASHGETAAGEIVGSGDASKTFQRFSLKKKPMTFLPSSKSAGVDSTLQLLVNGVRWREAPRLFGQLSTDQVYSLRTTEDGTSEIQFGDGVTGAIPPSGASNLVATYRHGIGLQGRVGKGTLTTLLQRLPGLKEVTNPKPAEGGADPETFAAARENAPQTVRTFGRAVSLRDVEDLVKVSGEVAKSHATRIWDGLARGIHLTVAGQKGGVFSPEGLGRLAASLKSARDPNHRLLIDNFQPVPVLVKASLQIHPDYVQEDVREAALEALVDALSFLQVGLGQSLHLSDLYRVLQLVPGVVSVDIDKLLFKQPAGVSAAQFELDLNRRRVTRLPDGTPDQLQGHLRIFSALSSTAGTSPAELAWVENPSQDLQLSATGGL